MPSGRKFNVIISLLALAVIASVSGCNSGDTSGPRTVEPMTKADINKQLDALKNNDKIPAGVKQQAMQKLQDQLASAR